MRPDNGRSLCGCTMLHAFGIGFSDFISLLPVNKSWEKKKMANYQSMWHSVDLQWIYALYCHRNGDGTACLEENQFSPSQRRTSDKDNEQTKWHFKKPTSLEHTVSIELNIRCALQHGDGARDRNNGTNTQHRAQILTVLNGFCVQIKFYNRHKFNGTWTQSFVHIDPPDIERMRITKKKKSNSGADINETLANLFVHVSQIEICFKQMQHLMRLAITSLTIIQENRR